MKKARHDGRAFPRAFRTPSSAQAGSTELVIKASAHDVAVVIEAAVVARAETTAAGNDGDVHRVIPEIVEQVLGLHGPVWRERMLDAGAYGIAGFGTAVVASKLQLTDRPEEIDAVFDLRISETAGGINKGAIPGIADATAHSAEIIHVRAEGIVERCAGRRYSHDGYVPPNIDIRNVSL